VDGTASAPAVNPGRAGRASAPMMPHRVHTPSVAQTPAPARDRATGPHSGSSSGPPAQDHEVVGVGHDARAEAFLQPEHLPSQPFRDDHAPITPQPTSPPSNTWNPESPGKGFPPTCAACPAPPPHARAAGCVTASIPPSDHRPAPRRAAAAATLRSWPPASA
jgi:hypothetical protein